MACPVRKTRRRSTPVLEGTRLICAGRHKPEIEGNRGGPFLFKCASLSVEHVKSGLHAKSGLHVSAHIPAIVSVTMACLDIDLRLLS